MLWFEKFKFVLIFVPGRVLGQHKLMIDHDRLFKELLTAHALEYIELFMPEAAAYLEKDSLQPADKELSADIPGVPRQEADLVFGDRFKGQDA